MTNSTTPDISVIVPVYNSENSLRLLIERLHPVLKSCAHHFEVLLINDDSRDKSWNIIQDLSREHSWVRGISLFRNFGQHNALLCGIRAARHAVIITLDDDLQNPPEEIPKLLEPLVQGWDVVYGNPIRSRHGLLRGCASQLIKWSLQKTNRADVAQKVSPFRAFRRSIAEAFSLNFKVPFFSLDVLLSWGTTRFTSVNVDHHEP